MPIFEQKFDLNATGTDYKSNLKVNRLSNVGLAGVKLRMEGKVVVKDSAKLGYYCTFIYDESKNPNPICLRYRTKQAIVV